MEKNLDMFRNKEPASVTDSYVVESSLVVPPVVVACDAVSWPLVPSSISSSEHL